MNKIKFLLTVFIIFISFALGFQSSVLIDSINSNTGSKVISINDLDCGSIRDYTILDLEKIKMVYDAVNGLFFDREQFELANSGSNLTDEAIRGMVEGFGDPYTIYLKPTKSVELKNSISGVLDGGIGAQLTQRGQEIIVLTPIKKTPAERAGIKAKDVILKVDDISLEGKNVNDAVKMIRGPKGTPVKLTIAREGEGIKEFTIIRDEIKIPSVDSKIQSGILIIELIQFDNDTGNEIYGIINENDMKNIKGIILDLRNNPGGYMEGAVEVASYWIPGNELVVYRKENNGQRYDMVSKGYTTFNGKPTIVLINGASASSSEIVAGALQDYKQAYIVGEKSFGKGSVQEIVDFYDGSSLKVTTAKWYTPNGNNIDHTGIIPDYEVHNNIENLKNGIDDQLNTALNILYTGIFPQSNTKSGSVINNNQNSTDELNNNNGVNNDENN